MERVKDKSKPCGFNFEEAFLIFKLVCDSKKYVAMGKMTKLPFF